MSERVVYASPGVDLARAAYVRHCVAIEAEGADLPELEQDIRRRRLAYEGFRLDLLRPPPKLRVDGQETVLRVANAITGRPDLTHPRVELVVIATARRWVCGRLISRGLNRWLLGKQRPFHFSSALPQRLSRALVNLVASPGDTMIDPCCGIGTALIEALEAGVFASGSDNNLKMLRALAANLRHLGLPLRLYAADARVLAGHFDAAVLDLPYGRNLPLADDLCRDIFRALRPAVCRAAVVAAAPLEPVLAEAGFACQRLIRVPKGQMVRYIHVVS